MKQNENVLDTNKDNSMITIYTLIGWVVDDYDYDYDWALNH